MTADIEMLPLPEWTAHNIHVPDALQQRVLDYARAVAEHNVAAKDAEIEQANRQRDLAQQGWQDAEDSNAELHAEIEVLRAELDRLRGEHVRVRRDRNAAKARAEQLMEVLQGVVDALGSKLHTTSDGRVYLPEHETRVALAAAQDILSEYKK